MANYAYLCASDYGSIYPAFAHESYDPATNTVARCAWNVPLLWFGLFRPSDMVTHTFTTDDGPYTVTAPVALKSVAVEQLTAAVPRLNKIFARQGQLDEYAALLAAAVRATAGAYLTIEWDEIAVITREDFIGAANDALASLDPAVDPDPDASARLIRLAGIERPDRPFPPARLDDLPISGVPIDDEDVYTHSRVIGARHIRTVPWEA